MRRCMVILAFFLVACGSGPTTTEKTQPSTPPAQATVAPAAAQATPNVNATVEAAVKATMGAAPKPAAATIAPTAIPKPAAAPTKPSGAAVKVEVQQFNHYVNSIGSTVIQGIVANTGDAPAALVQVAASLLAEGGATVGAGDAFVTPGLMTPGQKGVFEINVTKGPAFKDVKLQVQARAAGGPFNAYTDLKTDGVTVSPPAGGSKWGKVTGQVVNTGKESANLIILMIAIYNGDGTLYFVGTTTPKLSEVGPGQSSPFEFTFFTNREAIPIEKYDIFLSGR